MAERFVNTFKRDHVARMDLSDAQTVLEQLPRVFGHFSEVRPHSSLKMRSPREFGRQQAAGADQALCCQQGGAGTPGQHHSCRSRPLKLPTIVSSVCVPRREKRSSTAFS
ncbi:hypothetical protein D7U98_14640 [Stenotrophomonas maltophilia]|nr:hypothetical protein [Stenotrophomonas maltophilia]